MTRIVKSIFLGGGPVTAGVHFPGGRVLSVQATGNNLRWYDTPKRLRTSIPPDEIREVF